MAVPGDALDGPAGPAGGPVLALADRPPGLVGDEVLAVEAPEPHRLGLVEELHDRSMVMMMVMMMQAKDGRTL